LNDCKTVYLEIMIKLEKQMSREIIMIRLCNSAIFIKKRGVMPWFSLAWPLFFRDNKKDYDKILIIILNFPKLKKLTLNKSFRLLNDCQNGLFRNHNQIGRATVKLSREIIVISLCNSAIFIKKCFQLESLCKFFHQFFF